MPELTIDPGTAVRVPRRRGAAAAARYVVPVLLLWALPLGLLVWLLPVGPAVEVDATDGDGPVSVTVGTRTQDFRQSVQVTVGLAEPPVVRSAQSGLITALAVDPGGEIAAGSSILSVDGRSIAAFRGDQPLYRDLSRGASGPDVAALASFLVAAGVLDEDDESDAFGRAIANGVCTYQKRIGLECDGIFRPGYVMFVPAGFGRSASVALGVGEQLAVGATVLVGAQQPTAVTFKPTSDGASTAPFGASAVAVSDLSGGSVELASVAPAGDDIARMNQFLIDGVQRQSVRTEAPEAAGSDDAAPRSATYTGLTVALSQPRRSAVVPNTAVYVAPSGAACLFEPALPEKAASAAASVTDSAMTRPTPGPRHAAAIRLESVPGAGTDPGQSTVADPLAGRTIVRDVARLSAEELAGCA